MAQAKLTKRKIDAAQASDRDDYIWDAELTGYGLKITPKGRKVYLVQYRIGGRRGRTRRVTIGVHGSPWTPETARDEAKRLLAEVALGRDPAEERTRRRTESTVGEIADRYLSEHVEFHNKASTKREATRIVNARIRPEFGPTKISDLSRGRIKAWHQSMQHAPYEANRSLAYLSKMMSLACNEWELRSDNPCKGIRRFPEKARERYFTEEELKRIGQALNAAESHGTALPGYVNAVRLLALTGMRLGELMRLRWAEVDVEGRMIRLTDAKTGARSVPIGEPVTEILCDIPRDGELVLHDADPKTPLSQWAFRRLWNHVRDEADIPDGRPHDFRHTAGTFAAQAGHNAFIVRDLLGHNSLAMTNRYVERAADPVRAAAESFAVRVSRALSDG